jgi:hypothetical protein
MNIDLKHVINNSGFIDKVAVILFETTHREKQEFDESPVKKIMPINANPDQLTGKKGIF